METPLPKKLLYGRRWRNRTSSTSGRTTEESTADAAESRLCSTPAAVGSSPIIIAGNVQPMNDPNSSGDSFKTSAKLGQACKLCSCSFKQPNKCSIVSEEECMKITTVDTLLVEPEMLTDCSLSNNSVSLCSTSVCRSNHDSCDSGQYSMRSISSNEVQPIAHSSFVMTSLPFTTATQSPCCDICCKSSPLSAHAPLPERVQSLQKLYCCSLCSQTFTDEDNLTAHQRTHSVERPFSCKICGRAFEHSGKLNRHLRIHTGERPHKCKVCAKSFVQSGQLVIHMRAHTGEKPYACDTCAKAFTCSKQLKVHRRTHTGEKPYKCDICGKCFGYNHVLKTHRNSHYGQRLYKCRLCHTTFAHKKLMEEHLVVCRNSSDKKGKTSEKLSLEDGAITPLRTSDSSVVQPQCSSVVSNSTEKEDRMGLMTTVSSQNHLTYPDGQLLTTSLPMAGVSSSAFTISAFQPVSRFVPESFARGSLMPKFVSEAVESSCSVIDFGSAFQPFMPRQIEHSALDTDQRKSIVRQSPIISTCHTYYDASDSNSPLSCSSLPQVHQKVNTSSVSWRPHFRKATDVSFNRKVAHALVHVVGTERLKLLCRPLCSFDRLIEKVLEHLGGAPCSPTDDHIWHSQHIVDRSICNKRSILKHLVPEEQHMWLQSAWTETGLEEIYEQLFDWCASNCDGRNEQFWNQMGYCGPNEESCVSNGSLSTFCQSNTSQMSPSSSLTADIVVTQLSDSSDEKESECQNVEALSDVNYNS